MTRPATSKGRHIASYRCVWSVKGDTDRGPLVGCRPGLTALRTPRARKNQFQLRRLRTMTVTATQAKLRPSPRVPNASHPFSMWPVRTSKFCPQNPARKAIGRKMVATAANRRFTIARCLLASGRVQTVQRCASLLDCGEVGHDLEQLLVDVLGVQFGLGGGAWKGPDERSPGCEIPAWCEDPSDLCCSTLY